MIRATLLIGLALSASALAEAPSEPPKDLYQYSLVETVSFRSPAGESSSVLRGLAEVTEDQARLALERGTFPRTTAHLAVAEGKDVYLLDRNQKVYARASLGELRDLFLGGEEGQAGFGSFTVRDLQVTVAPDGGKASGAGALAYDGRPASRYRVSVSWTDVLALPGRVTQVRNRVNGTLVFCEALLGARAPWDDVSRLFRVRGEVREALDRELAAVKGLLVRADVEGDSESGAEPIGGLSGIEPAARPVTSSFRAERQVTGLSIRKATPAVRASLRVPEDFHSRSLDRVLKEPRPPR